MTDRVNPAEFVFPGHPDKLSDAIADTLVQEASQREKRALVGVEVAVHRNKVYITGRIACVGADSIDIGGLVRGAGSSCTSVHCGDTAGAGVGTLRYCRLYYHYCGHYYNYYRPNHLWTLYSLPSVSGFLQLLHSCLEMTM